MSTHTSSTSWYKLVVRGLARKASPAGTAPQKPYVGSGRPAVSSAVADQVARALHGREAMVMGLHSRVLRAYQSRSRNP
jgi:hypothetical protein